MLTPLDCQWRTCPLTKKLGYSYVTYMLSLRATCFWECGSMHVQQSVKNVRRRAKRTYYVERVSTMWARFRTAQNAKIWSIFKTITRTGTYVSTSYRCDLQYRYELHVHVQFVPARLPHSLLWIRWTLKHTRFSPTKWMIHITLKTHFFAILN